MLILAHPTTNMRVKYRPTADKGRLEGALVHQPHHIRVIKTLAQVQAMMAAADHYGKMHARVVSFDEYKMELLLPGGQSMHVDRNHIHGLTSSSPNINVPNIMLHFRTYHVVVRVGRNDVTKIAITDVGIDMRVNADYEMNAISNASLRTAMSRGGYDMYVGSFIPGRLPCPALTFNDVMNDGQLSRHTFSSLIAASRISMAKRGGNDAMEPELRDLYDVLANKIAARVPINVLVNGEELCDMATWIDLINRSFAGTPSILINTIGLLINIQPDSTPHNLYTTNHGLVPTATPDPSIPARLSKILIMTQNAESPLPLPPIGHSVPPPPAITKQAILVFTCLVQNTLRVPVHNDSLFGGAAIPQDDVTLATLSDEPGLYLCYESDNRNGAQSMAKYILALNPCLVMHHMARTHKHYSYLLFTYAGPCMLDDNTQALPSIFALFTDTASTINSRGDSSHFRAITACQLEGRVAGALTVVCADDYAGSMPRFAVEFGCHAVFPMGGNELRVFPQDTELVDAAALTHYLGALNAFPLHEQGRKQPNPPFRYVIDHSGKDAVVHTVPGSTLVLHNRSAGDWAVANARPAIDRSLAGFFIKGIPARYPPSTIVLLLSSLGITESVLAAGAWWAPQPQVLGPLACSSCHWATSPD